MASSLNVLWRKLLVADGHKSQNTVFFFSFERYQHALKLQVTDLVYIWTAAKTSKAELIEEAIRTRCNIDPSEDDEQYEVLVTKLEEAVSGRDGASCLLVPDQKTSNPVRFEMKTTIPLPAPLGTLEWTFQMVRQEPSIFTQELVIPALRVIDASRRREEDLRRRIKEKDHVIGKLMDKIEGAGIDLSMVFPGFAGARKGLNARQAAMVVPGIEAFRDGESGRYWKDGDDIGLNGLVDALKAPETGSLVWEVPLRPTREPNGGPPDQQRPVHHAAMHHDDTDSSEPSFQNSGARRQSSSSSSSSAPTRSRETSSKRRLTKSGRLGGIRSKPVPVQKRSSSSSSPQRPPKASTQLSSASTDTTTESEPEAASTATKTRNETPGKPISRMGIIGGRKPPIPSKEKTNSPEPSSEPSQSTPSRRNVKLGVIGGKKSKTASPAPREHDSTESLTASPSPPPLPGTKQTITDVEGVLKHSLTPSKAEEPMTGAERANQRRLELKRQLDEGTGKRKKTKF